MTMPHERQRPRRSIQFHRLGEGTVVSEDRFNEILRTVEDMDRGQRLQLRCKLDHIGEQHGDMLTEDDISNWPPESGTKRPGDV